MFRCLSMLALVSERKW